MSFVSVTARAAERPPAICGVLLSADGMESDVTLRDFRPAWDFPLPPAVEDELVRHPISRWATRPREARYILDIEIATAADHSLDSAFKGESLQALVLSKYLKAVFPDALLRTNWQKPTASSARRKFVKFKIDDPADSADGRGAVARYGNLSPSALYALDADGRCSATHISMPLLKMGAPRLLGDLAKSDIRRASGLPDHYKIISVYALDGRILSDAEELLRRLAELNPRTLIILSFNAENREGPGLPKLSGIRTERAIPDVVWNDSVHRMPYVHLAADVAVIVGAINFFEPLNHGVATVVYLPDRYRDRYGRDVLEHMLQIASRSNGLLVANSVPQLERAVGQALGRKRIVSPPSMTPKFGRTPFQLVLDRLLKMLQAQTGID